MVIAGEASGDLHAAHLMEELRKIDISASFVFLGGDRMAAVSGVEPLIHIREMAFMGFSEVLRNLGAIRHNLQITKKALEEVRPDALILVDYPSFNLKIAKHAKKFGIKVFYYISPKVWAWKEYRVKDIKRLVDRMYVIFPFEVEFYHKRHDYEVEFVGNPSVAEVDDALKKLCDRTEFLKKYGLRDRPIIALLPGSRVGEIRNNLRIMNAVTERYPQYRGVIAGAPNIDLSLYRQHSDLPVIYDDTFNLLAHSRAALVTSGTATLESALTRTPQVACYRSNGSKLAYSVMERLLKVDFVTLPNLIAGSEVIPELLLHNCTVDNIAEALTPLLTETPSRMEMMRGYDSIRQILTAPGSAPANAARSITTAIG